MPTVSGVKRGMKRPPLEKGRWAAKGTKPLPQQASVQYILTLFVVHGCRKVLFVQTEVKIALYSLGLFFGSLIFDFLPIPRIYLGYNDNFLNVYFVKIGWLWTSLIVGAFIYLTSITYGCGRIEIVKRHMSRLIVSTLIWLFWSQIVFPYVEASTGVCLGKAILKDKWPCVNGGYQWHAFDISGHAFLLVYINLFIVEEAKAIVGWEGIKDLIRMEDFQRVGEVAQGDDDTATSLKDLSDEEYDILKNNYEYFTPFIRGVFVLMTIISIVSDVMLTCTVVYFHTMPQKVVGGGIAMALWYFTYRFWYKCNASPGLPGNGLFKYQHMREKARESVNRRHSLCKEHRDVPMFMGMPIYGAKKDKEEKKKDEDDLDNISEFCDPRHRPDKKQSIGDSKYFGSDSRIGIDPRHRPIKR